MEYKVSELADKAGVTKRTIHYYISKGLLLPPEGNGVNSLYNDEYTLKKIYVIYLKFIIQRKMEKNINILLIM